MKITDSVNKDIRSAKFINNSEITDPRRSRKSRRSAYPRPSKQIRLTSDHKGKSRAIENEDNMMDVDDLVMAEDADMDCTVDEHGDGDEGCEAEGQGGRPMGRRYTKLEEKKIDELRISTKEAVSQIAEEFGRNPKDVMQRAGLSTKAMRKDNLSNLYKTWYGMTHDKDPDCKFISSQSVILTVTHYNHC